MKLTQFLVLILINIVIQASAVKLGVALLIAGNPLVPSMSFLQAVGLVLVVSTLRGQLKVSNKE